MEDHFGMNILLDATLSANAADAPLLSPATIASGLHQCRVCRRTYERADHLNRHLKSHENARHFHCSRCPKRFNRADLLSRHLATHERHSTRDPDRPLIKRTDRAAEACLACAASKSKCEDQKPCRRCRTKNIPCETTSSSFTVLAHSTRGDNSPTANGEHQEQLSGHTSHPIAPDQPHSAYPASSSIADGNLGTFDVGRTPYSTSGQGYAGPIGGQQKDYHVPSAGNHELPPTSMYAQGYPNMNDMMFLPNVSEFNQDLDFGFWDFSFEGVRLGAVTSVPDMVMTHNSSTPSNQGSIPMIPRDISRGYAAFKRSPWLWTPAQKDHQLSDQEHIALDEASIHSGLTPSSAVSMSPEEYPRTPQLDSGLRDQMFALVVKMIADGPTRSIVPTFPSLDILNHIMHIFFVRQTYQVDNWIHAGTFQPDKTPTQLLLALISAGSMFISVPAIWKMGLALQEVVRLAVVELWETKNRTTRDIQAIQSFMICIDVGLWSGFKRKMEIAEAFGQPLITMLRRAGVFCASLDKNGLRPDLLDSLEQLENKWRKWIQRESFKRLAIHLFLHDTRASAALQKPPLLPFSELNFSIPASRDLWLADSAVKWRAQFLAKRPLTSPLIPRMMDVMHDSSLLDSLREHIDVGLCSVALLHGFWGQVYSYQESSKFYLGSHEGPSNATHRLLLTAQHRELYQDIETFAAKVSDLPKRPPGILTVVEFFMMTLHVLPDELQRFAGKSGEDEAARAAINLQKWILTPEARRAAWHAGQVFRAAKAMPPAELRDFHAIAVYFASLTLWAYGHMSHTKSNENEGLPLHTQNQPNDSIQVAMDGPETRETRVFLSLGQGVPGLSYPYNGESIFESLTNANMVLKIGRDIYRNNFPALDEPLPALVDNLGNLMRDLGSLPGSRFSRSESEDHGADH